MGTKENPGKYDCLKKLAKDEPFFVLRGQDGTSPHLVRSWIMLARAAGCPEEKLAEAEECAKAMEAWPNRKNPD